MSNLEEIITAEKAAEIAEKQLNELTGKIIGAAIEVHHSFDPSRSSNILSEAFWVQGRIVD